MKGVDAIVPKLTLKTPIQRYIVKMPDSTVMIQKEIAKLSEGIKFCPLIPQGILQTL